MMGRLRAMREPLKYVQGRDALYKFHEEMGYMGKRWLFVCSNSGYKVCHEKIEKSFEGLDDYRRYEIFGGISSNGEIKKMEDIVKEDNIDQIKLRMSDIDDIPDISDTTGDGKTDQTDRTHRHLQHHDQSR